MSTNKSTHYNLHLWEPEDAFVRTEFNENTTKVDTALRGLETSKAKQSDMTALQTTVGNKANTSTVNSINSTLTSAVNLRCRMKTGVYNGDGSASRTINVGFPVKAVLVERTNGVRTYQMQNPILAGLAVEGGDLGNAVQISGNGFVVSHTNSAFLNTSGYTYLYVAWG